MPSIHEYRDSADILRATAEMLERLHGGHLQTQARIDASYKAIRDSQTAIRKASTASRSSPTATSDGSDV